jgi:hypothetical protein
MIPTEDQANALRWLDDLAKDYPHWVAVLKAMLSEPRLSEEPTPRILERMMKGPLEEGAADEYYNRQAARDVMAAAYRALYAHLTKADPKPAPSSNGLPLHIVIDQTQPGTNAVLEQVLEAMVRAGMVTVGGSIGNRINARIGHNPEAP